MVVAVTRAVSWFRDDNGSSRSQTKWALIKKQMYFMTKLRVSTGERTGA